MHARRLPLVFAAALAAVGLRAQGPGPRAFDFWIGEWDTPSYTPDADGDWQPSTVRTMRVEAVAGGQAIAEYAASVGTDRQSYGYSLRTFDPDTGRWTLLLNWPSPGNSFFYSLTGAFRHGRGEFLARRPMPDGGAMWTRFTFSDIAVHRLRWDGANSRDDRRTWQTNMLFEFTRRAPDAAPLPNGRGTTATWNLDDPRARAFDFLRGSWVGTRTRSPEGDPAGGVPVCVEGRTIMAGSAFVTETEVGAAADACAEYAVGAFDTKLGQWVRYEVVQDVVGMRRHVRADGDGLRLIGAAGPASTGADDELVWLDTDGDEIVCERRRTRADGGVELVWRQELRRRR